MRWVQVDVWALGITAIEMAESQPPKWAVNPMRVIFMITREPPPQLADLDRWSLPFHDFVAQSLQKASSTHWKPNACTVTALYLSSSHPTSLWARLRHQLAAASATHRPREERPPEACIPPTSELGQAKTAVRAEDRCTVRVGCGRQPLGPSPLFQTNYGNAYHPRSTIWNVTSHGGVFVWAIHDLGFSPLQDPKTRPSAKYLQQHKFVVNARQSAAASLIPLIKQSRDLLAQMGEESPITLPGGR